jgi:hypothetical protein
MTCEAYKLNPFLKEPASKESIGLIKGVIKRLAVQGRDLLDAETLKYSAKYILENADIGNIKSKVEIFVDYSPPAKRIEGQEEGLEQFRLTRTRYADLTCLDPNYGVEEFVYSYSLSLTNDPNNERENDQAIVEIYPSEVLSALGRQQLSGDMENLFKEWWSLLLNLKKKGYGVVEKKVRGERVVQLRQPLHIAHEGLIESLLSELSRFDLRVSL